MNQLATKPQTQQPAADEAMSLIPGIWVARDLDGWIFAYVNCPLWTGEQFILHPAGALKEYMEVPGGEFPEVLPGHRMQLIPSMRIEDCTGKDAEQ